MKKINRTLWIGVFLVSGASWTGAQAAQVTGFYGHGPIKTYVLDGETFVDGPRIDPNEFSPPAEIVNQRPGYVKIRAQGHSYWLKALSVKIGGRGKSSITPVCDKLATQSPQTVQSGTMGAGDAKCVTR